MIEQSMVIIEPVGHSDEPSQELEMDNDSGW